MFDVDTLVSIGVVIGIVWLVCFALAVVAFVIILLNYLWGDY